MTITICGSVRFAPRLVEIYRQLEALGHQPLMHEKMFMIADGTDPELIAAINADHSQAKRKYNFIKSWHDLIKSGEAILVCNFSKDGIKNYIGGNTFLEIGFAYVSGKKIYLLNDIPEMTYTDEIKAMQPLVINNDLDKIA